MLNFRFRRQHAIGQFIVDFYCSEGRLVIEVDGPVHKRSVDEDRARQQFLEQRGLKVLRVINEEVEEDIESVLTRVEGFLRA